MSSVEFSKMVSDCRKKESTQIIHNASYEHAKILFNNLIQEAGEKNEDITIVSGELFLDFYESLIPDTEKALQKGIKISLAVCNIPENFDTHPFVSLLKKYNMSIYKPVEGCVSLPHFIVVGTKRFRLEIDHKQTKAIACFNNEQIGKILKTIFDQCISKNLLQPVVV
jgi:hypothetical protein